MGVASGPSRSSRQVAQDVAVGTLGLTGIGATIASVVTISVAIYRAIVIYDRSLGGRDFGDFGIAGLVGLVTGVGITGMTLAAVLYRNRNQGDYRKIIGTSAVMVGLAVIAGLALVVVLAIAKS